MHCIYLRKSRADDPLLSVEEVLSKHETILDEWNYVESWGDGFTESIKVIIGHKGASLLDTGYIYAPYVPMQLTPTIYNAENFAPVKGIITRYAKKMVNNRYYGAIVCSGLQTWNIMELR